MRRDRPDTALPLAGVAAALIAVVCCAGLPALGALLASVTLMAVLGIGGVLIGAVTVTAVVIAARHRRQRGCASKSTRRSL